MTRYRCTAQGHTPEGEMWITGLWMEADALTIAAAGAAWHDAFNILWLGLAAPADNIDQFIKTTCGCDETVVNSTNFAMTHNVEQFRTAESLVGTDAGDAWPPQASVVLTTRSGVPTRSGRGRMYLPTFTTAGDSTVGEITSGVAAKIALGGKNMMASLVSDGFTPVIAHRQTESTDAIISVDVNTIIGTQRRRRNKLVGSRSSQSL